VLTDRTLGTWLTRWFLGRLEISRRCLGQGVRGVPQQRAALREFRLPHAVGQEAEMPYPLEAARWDMEHQPPQEFHGIERQGA